MIIIWPLILKTLFLFTKAVLIFFFSDAFSGACPPKGKAEEVGRAEFNLATPTYSTVAYSVR